VKPIPRLEGLVVGFGLVAVGALWTLSNLGRLDLLDTLRTFWPSLLVLWGALELYNWRVRAAARAVPPPPPAPLEEPRWYDRTDDPVATRPDDDTERAS
jgi:hypothetical protein